MSEIQNKSRLGLLLVKKGLLTNSQLDQALKIQLRTQQRLGEVLIEQGLLTERQLQKALKKQSRKRVLATFIAMLLGPLSFGVFANQSSHSNQEAASSSQTMKHYQGLKSLDDSELDTIQGQGLLTGGKTLGEIVQSLQSDDTHGESGLQALDEISTALNPLSSLLDADISINGVTYHDQTPKQVIHEDGSIELALPAEIKEIAMRDLRVKGADKGSSFGDVVISGIKFSEHSSIRIKIHN